MENIKFGTDGWRGVIADDFTFKNVDLLVHAVARYFSEKRNTLSKKIKKDLIVIGYDNRFLSPDTAERAATIFSESGFKVVLSKTSLPTPAVALAIKSRNALGGIIVTASHNPYRFNGIKLRSHDGVSVSKNETSVIEGFLENGGTVAERGRPAKIEYTDLRSEYLAYLKKHFKSAAIKKAKIKVVVDPMHGSGLLCLEDLINSSDIKFMSIRSSRDPVFGMVNPEPIESNLSALKEAVIKEKADIGIAFDGDADRIGMMDSRGRFVNSHHIFALLLMHMAGNRKLSGRVIKTISGSYLIDRISAGFGLELVETPIGFKYVSEKFLEGDVLIGGEESGGIAFKGYLEERDGIYAALMMLEYLAVSGKKLDKLMNDLHKEYGDSHYIRKDVNLKQPVEPLELYSRIGKSYKKVLGKNIKKVFDFDGMKFVWGDDSWLLIRASGTEPVLRLYAEHPSGKGAENLLAQAVKLMNLVKAN